MSKAWPNPRVPKVHHLCKAMEARYHCSMIVYIGHVKLNDYYNSATLPSIRPMKTIANYGAVLRPVA